MTTPLTAEQREELRRLEKELPQFELDDSGEEPLVTLYVVGTSDFAKARSAAVAQSMVQMRNALPALLDDADRAEELERELESVRTELDSATTRGCELVEEAEQRAEELEARVRRLEGLLASAMRWTVGMPRLLEDKIMAALPRPQPGDERRDEQGKAEQLVGPGDGPNDRDDR